MWKRRKLLALAVLAVVLTIVTIPAWYDMVARSDPIDWQGSEVTLLVPNSRQLKAQLEICRIMIHTILGHT